MTNRPDSHKNDARETLTIYAVYEEGKLRPLTPLPCEEQERVLLKVVRQSAVQATQAVLKGVDPAIVREVAEDDAFSLLD